MPELRGRNRPAYIAKAHALKRRVAKEHLPCWICGRPIDTSLPYTSAMAFTADHLQPLAAGGKLLGALLPAHRECNSRRGAGRPVRQNQAIVMPHSRVW